MKIDYEWDPDKAQINLQKHGVRFMKDHYDFTGGRRGAIDPTLAGKTRITIRIDDDVLEWFREVVDEAGGGSYQALMNGALREYMMRQREPLELTLRRVVREELAAYSAGSASEKTNDDSR